MMQVFSGGDPDARTTNNPWLFVPWLRTSLHATTPIAVFMRKEAMNISSGLSRNSRIELVRLIFRSCVSPFLLIQRSLHSKGGFGQPLNALVYEVSYTVLILGFFVDLHIRRQQERC